MSKDQATQNGAFDSASAMELPLSIGTDLFRALALIAETLDNEEGSVVQRLAWIGVEHCRKAEALRRNIFRAAHPNREHFEKVGWPEADTGSGAS